MPSGRKPFILAWNRTSAYNAPDNPIQPPEERLQAYQKRHPEVDLRRAKLAALIEHMDDGVGRVLETLADLKLEEETLVFFTSDNGGALQFGANNGPLRDGKGTTYEGGIRVPAAVRWPGKMAEKEPAEFASLRSMLEGHIARFAEVPYRASDGSGPGEIERPARKKQ